MEPQQQQPRGPTWPGSGPGFVTPADGELFAVNKSRHQRREAVCLRYKARGPEDISPFRLLTSDLVSLPALLLGGDSHGGRKLRTASLANCFITPSKRGSMRVRAQQQRSVTAVPFLGSLPIT